MLTQGMMGLIFPILAIRDFEQIDTLAARAGYRLHVDHGMPVNNRLLVWHKRLEDELKSAPKAPF